MSAQVCPLCMGGGWRIDSFTAQTDAVCRACDGKGVVWSPPDSRETTMQGDVPEFCWYIEAPAGYPYGLLTFTEADTLKFKTPNHKFRRADHDRERRKELADRLASTLGADPHCDCKDCTAVRDAIAYLRERSQ